MWEVSGGLNVGNLVLTAQLCRREKYKAHFGHLIYSMYDEKDFAYFSHFIYLKL